jgi:Ca2+-binding RTX toxin-like protein
LNSRIKIALVACLTVSLFAGFSSFLGTKEANAAFNAKIEGVGIGQGLNCRHPGDEEPLILNRIIINVQNLGGRVSGSIIFDEKPIVQGDLVLASVKSLFAGPGPDVQFGIEGTLQLPREDTSCGDRNFVLAGKCHIGTPRDTVTYTSSNNRATWDVLYSVCEAAFGPGNPPPNSSICEIGTTNNDNLIGTSRNDCIDGKRGNDKIAGLAGNDKLNGGDGKDLLTGGNGNDELTGGKGSDKFDCGAGNDKITDFNPSERDIKSTNCEQF